MRGVVRDGIYGQEVLRGGRGIIRDGVDRERRC